MRDLLPTPYNTTGETVQICGANGDATSYPLAYVHLDVEGVKLQVTADISQALPVSVLLGTDVPELGQLLQATPYADAMVMTRAQTRRNVTIEDKYYQKDARSQVLPKPIVDTPTSSEHSPVQHPF